MTARPRLRCSSIALVLSVAAGCAGGPTRSTLPDAERAAVDVLPADAFFAMRVDVADVRALRGWDAIELTLRETQPDAAAAWRAIDTIHLAVGGLVPVTLPPEPAAPPRATDAPESPEDATQAPEPEIPEEDVGAVPLDEVAPDFEEAEPVPGEPAWVEMARALDGHVPRIVLAVEGSDVSACLDLAQTTERRTVGPWEVAVDDGWAFALRGDDLCVVTFEVLLDEVLAGGQGAPRIVDRLYAVGENGDPGLVGVALELDSPGFHAITEAFTKAANELTYDAEGDDDASDEDAVYLRLAERVLDELLEGIDAVEWQLGRSGASFASRTRVHAGDVDRGVMWRELVEITLGIVAAIGESDLAGPAVSHAIDTLVSSTRVEPRDDGFVLVSRVSDDFVTGFVEGLATQEGGEDEDEIDGLDEALLLEDELYDLPARERISRLEPLVEAWLGDTEMAVELMVLSDAYAYVGRFDDARRLLERVAAAVSPEERAYVAIARAELEIESGRAAAARPIVETELARTSEDEAPVDFYHLLGLRVLALALADEGEGARDLERFDASVLNAYIPAATPVGLRARILVASGRFGEASAALEALCLTTPDDCDLRTRTTLVEAAARAGGSASHVRALVARYFPPEGSLGFREEERAIGRYLECLALAHGESATRARDVCGEAVEIARAQHGETHPVTAAAALEHARVLTAARDGEGARRELARVDAALALLGPTHPLRALRASFGARRRGR